MSDKQDRYQYQPWYIKLWRRRHYILIPFSAFKMWARGVFDKCQFRFCWSIAKGIAQCNMNWVYDWEEVKERLDKKIEEFK
jgi:hypothetical protein